MSTKTPMRHLCALLLVCSPWLPGVAISATECINQNTPSPLEICVHDNGTPGVWVDQPDGRTRQYYGEYSWGSTIWLNGTDTSQSYHTGYFWSVPNAVTPVSNNSSGSGTAADPYVITTIVDLGTSGVRLTQRFFYVNGDRTFRKSWSFENNSADTTYSDLRLIHGGDTYFGGEDSARSWWDPDNSMIYVNNENFTNAGLMGFFANPATPAVGYMGGNYSNVINAAATGQLPNTADSNFVDAGYALQWNLASLAPGQTSTIEAFETWSPPGALQVIAPANDYVLAGSTVQRVFKVQNLSADPLTVSLTAASVPAGWNVSLPDGSTIDLNSLEVAEVPVDVEVPADAEGGTIYDIEITANADPLYESTAATRLTVLQVDYTLAPESLLFNGVEVGDSATIAITLTNGAGGAPVETGQIGAGNGLAAPFSITVDNCSNTTLNAGESCSVEVTFARAADAASADTFAWPFFAPTLTTRTIEVASAELLSEYPVDAMAGTGGTISPASVQVLRNDTSSFTVTPDAGYSIAAVQGCGGSLIGNTYTTGEIVSACTVTASFAINTYTVAATAGAGGAIGPASAEVNHGSSTSFALTPGTNYSIAAVQGCGGSLTGNTYTTGLITSACAVTASFALKTYTVAATAGAGGIISPASVQVSHGSGTSFAVTPNNGYSIASAAGCGGSLSGNTYTTGPVTGACSVVASFSGAPGPVFQPSPLPDYDLLSTELMTRLPEDMAPTALDAEGREVAVTLVGGKTRFAPGLHILTWRAVDSNGAVTTIEQTLLVWPIVSMGKDVSVGFQQDNVGSFRIALNGLAPEYPYMVSYDASGYLQGHNLENGSVLLQAGEIEKEVLFAILETPVEGTPDQQVVVRLSGVENAGARDSLIANLLTADIPPSVRITAAQEGKSGPAFGRALGPITLTADILTDTAGTHTVQWESPTGTMVTTSGNELVFPPGSLPAGIYRFIVVVQDSETLLTTRAVIDIVIVDTPREVPEGVTSIGPNGLPDHPAYSPLLPNVLPEREAELDAYLMEAEPGLRLALGPHAIYQSKYQTELQDMQTSALTPDSIENVGGYFDFVISDLSSNGQSASVVIPQRAAIPAAPVYRKYDLSTQQWRNFVEAPGDALASAPGEPGHCPPPASSEYRSGLNGGDWCVRLTISDGGPNDADDEVNGVVVDPGGVGALAAIEITTTGKGTGGGSTGVSFLLGLLLVLLWRSRAALRRLRLPIASPAMRTLHAGHLDVPQARARGLAGIALPVLSVITLGGLSLPAEAADGDKGGFHVGMRAGVARGDVSESDLNARLAAAGLDATASFDDRTRTAWQLSAAYDFTRHFGVAVGYTNFETIGTRITGNVIDVQEALEITARAHPHSADGYELAMTGRYPLSDRLSLTGRAGAMRWESRYRAWNIDGRSYSERSSGTDGLYGVGIEVALFGRWRLLADYTRYPIDKETIEFGSLGLTYRTN